MAQNGFCSKDIYLLAGINYPCHTTIPKWALNGLQLVTGSFLQIQIYTIFFTVANAQWNNCPSNVQAVNRQKSSEGSRSLQDAFHVIENRASRLRQLRQIFINSKSGFPRNEFVSV